MAQSCSEQDYNNFVFGLKRIVDDLKNETEKRAQTLTEELKKATEGLDVKYAPQFDLNSLNARQNLMIYEYKSGGYFDAVLGLQPSFLVLFYHPDGESLSAHMRPEHFERRTGISASSINVVTYDFFVGVNGYYILARSNERKKSLSKFRLMEQYREPEYETVISIVQRFEDAGRFADVIKKATQPDITQWRSENTSAPATELPPTTRERNSFLRRLFGLR